MRVGLDVQTLETPERSRGIGRLCAGTIEALVRHAPEIRLCLFGLHPQMPEGVGSDLRERVTYEPLCIEGAAADHLRFGCAAPFLWTTPGASKLDLYHVTSPMMPDILLPLSGPVPVVATLLDAIPALEAERGDSATDAPAMARYRSRIATLRGYRHFLPISRSAARDCARLFDLSEERMTVTWVPVEQRPRSLKGPANDAARVRHGLREGYVIAVTGYNPRKNIAGTLAAYAGLPPALRRECPLVLVCSLQPQEQAEFREMARIAGVEKQVVLTGFVTDEELWGLLASAGAMLFLSRYEGFGIPVAEAMVAGVPVVASSTSSLPEAGGDSAVLVDPDDARGAARALEELLTDPKERERRRDLGYRHVARFAPDVYVDRLLAGYREATALALSTPTVVNDAPASLRIAHFSPLLPSMTGVADYAERLLLHFNATTEVDCFTDGVEPATAQVRDRFAVFDHSAFVKMQAEKPYDAILYHVGNNTLHAYELPYARAYPGFVVMHDSSLLAVERVLAQRQGQRHAARIRFAAEHPEADASAWEDDRRLNELDFARFPMTRSLLESSRAVIVHSEWLRDRVDELTAGRCRAVVVPHGISLLHADAPRPSRQDLRRRFLVPGDAFVVVSVGVVNWLKRIPEVLAAFATFHRSCPNSYFLIAGPADRVVLRQLDDYCRTNRLKQCVRFLGHRETAELYDFIALADVCVNLRYPTFGETSGTLMSILAMGKPALVTAVGQFLEFPDDVCVKIRLGPDERNELVACFRALRDNPEVAAALGRNARTFVEDWNWDRVARKFEDILRETSPREHKGQTLESQYL